MVVKTTKYLLLLILCCGATNVYAQSESLDSSFTVFGSLRTGGEFQEEETDIVYDAKDSSAYGLIWNTRHSLSLIHI